ncbi:response regulator [Acinetobacter baumannii]|uniref:response regulator n=1 Tax=Acinetobacter baumannii TaxID=470 RepID=UPI00244C7628|nr:response regulator [Acinetobacter baumannii]MDH2621147.1 response regulator [Acinetobacter baumannii]
MIYIIEDSELKIARILSFLKENGIQDVDINVYKSFHSGLKKIVKRPPDLIILDMTIPTFDKSIGGREGRMRPIGGYDLMQSLQLKKIPSKVVVLTQLEFFGEGSEKISFQEINRRCLDNFPDLFLECIYYSPTETSWQQLLSKYISDL